MIMTRILNALLTAALIALFIILIYTLGPELETRFYPVYSKFQVVRLEANPEGQGSVVTFRFIKYRDCLPRGSAWYSGDFGGTHKQMDMKSRRAPTAVPVPLGINTVTFDMNLTVSEFADGAWAETFSDCYPFWTTRSLIYP